jgi:hypothetical protein
MEEKMVKQYQCEFCGKKNYSKGHMRAHEKHCSVENNGWIDKEIKFPPLSNGLKTIRFLVLFQGEVVIGRNSLGELKIDGSNSDFSDKIRYWQPLPKVI